MDKITKFFECFIPVSCCNMYCEYCYVMQENRRENKMPEFKYSPKQIGVALTKKRLGGVCYFNLCGLGETLLPKEMPDIVEAILAQGHYVNITNNGTSTKAIDKIMELPKEMLKRLSFSFSLHYLELQRLNKIDQFFENVKKVRSAGCSFVVQFNLYDGYVPHIETVKQLCLEKIGAYPQVALTRDETNDRIEILFSESFDKYRKLGESFESSLFDFTCKNFNVKRKEFCYAGQWSFILNMATGMIKACYDEKEYQDIFKDPNESIKCRPVGNYCKSKYCVNSSHFMSLGIIPELNTPTYISLRNRQNADWYSDEMKDFLSSKFVENNKEFSVVKKESIIVRNAYKKALRSIKNVVKGIIR